MPQNTVIRKKQLPTKTIRQRLYIYRLVYLYVLKIGNKENTGLCFSLLGCIFFNKKYYENYYNIDYIETPIWFKSKEIFPEFGNYFLLDGKDTVIYQKLYNKDVYAWRIKILKEIIKKIEDQLIKC